MEAAADGPMITLEGEQQAWIVTIKITAPVFDFLILLILMLGCGCECRGWQ